MKAKITFKSGADVLVLDDLRETLPVEGETIHLRGQDYTVERVESAVVLVEPIPEQDQVESPTRSQSRARTLDRLKAESRGSKRTASRPAVRTSENTRAVRRINHSPSSSSVKSSKKSTAKKK